MASQDRVGAEPASAPSEPARAGEGRTSRGVEELGQERALERRVAVVILAAAVVSSLLIRGKLAFGPGTNASVDEGYFAAFAIALRQGHFLPYVDAVSQRGPVLYWLIGGVQSLFGLHRYLGMHLLMLVANCVTSLSLYWCARSVGSRLAGAVAALLWAVISSVSFLAADGLATTGEAIALPFLCGALALLSSARGASPAPRLVGAGVLLALAALTKQTAILGAPGYLLWLVVAGEGARRPRLKAFLAGVGIPFLLVFVPYAATGHLGELWYWTVVYNSTIYSAPWKAAGLAKTLSEFVFTGDRWGWMAVMRLILLMLAVVPSADALGPLLFAERRAAAPRELLGQCAGLIGAGLLVSALLTYRLWPHYFLLCVPFFCVSFALAWGARPRSGVSTLAFAAALLVFAAVGTTQRLDSLPAIGRPRPSKGPICRALDEHSAPGRKTFIWGFDADLYVSCERPPASRYLFSIMLAGVVPGAWDQHRAAWVVPGTRAILAGELRRGPPDTLLEIKDTMDRVRLASLPELRPILAEYCPPYLVSEPGRAAYLWARRPKDAECPVSGDSRRAR